MNGIISKVQGKSVLSQVPFDKLVDSFVSIGERISELKKESWRLKANTSVSTSLWAEIIDCLQLDQNERTRHSLYDLWHSNRHDIVTLVKRKKNMNNEKKSDDDDNHADDEENNLLLVEETVNLQANKSLPLPSRPNTRINERNNIDEDTVKYQFREETSFVCSAVEWKSAFSYTDQKMKKDFNWSNLFSQKLTATGIRCPLKFKQPYIRQGERKQRCRFFSCYAQCLYKSCERRYQIISMKQPVEVSSIVFLVRIYGKENHDVENELHGRKMQDQGRDDIGRRANEVGPLALFRELVEKADEDLLKAGNYTQCPTIEAIKKASFDYNKKMRFDEDIFKECRILCYSFEKDDVISSDVLGYIHEMGEMPFRAHLYTEMQIRRYTNYIKNAKYSYVHIDATGGILNKIHDQKRSLLYAMMFKDGPDVDDTVPLAHAILTRHTVASISFFLESVAEDIAEVNKKLILPSFFVIDFSAAIMNSVLKTFNWESITTHLNRCWNVLQCKYDAKQLRSSCYIHLCCCHVVHAVARSLNNARVDKKMRKAILHIFAILICSDDIDKLYDTLGLIIDIFGNQYEQKAEEKLEQLLSLQLYVDDESKSVLTDDEKIFEEATKKDDELKIVDEYLRANMPIIHQSPFNREAIRRYPNLSNLIDSKSKVDTSVNQSFSPSVIRIFYRWWAYLPLWTGLLWDFEERYSNDLKRTSLVLYNPIRYSNALIESYFRTLKYSICKRKKTVRPGPLMMDLHRSVKVRFKADEFGITQSSKGRKRKKKKVNVEEKWGKKNTGNKGRTIYFNMIDKLALKRARTKLTEDQVTRTIEKLSESEDTTTTSSIDKSNWDDESLNENSSITESPLHVENGSISSSSLSCSAVSDEHLINISIPLDKPTANQPENNEVSIRHDLKANVLNPTADELYSTPDLLTKMSIIQVPSQPYAMIDSHKIQWPRFGVKNVFFDGRSYSLILTCPVDTALLVLYFLYKVEIDFAAELEQAPQSTPYRILFETFQLVETNDWDIARIYWLLKFNIINSSDPKPQSLFGSVDEQVFSFLKVHQQHSSTITCSRLDCKQKVRSYTTTELTIRCCDMQIEQFETETPGVCSVMMKTRQEITEAEAIKKKYKDSRIPIINYHTNKTEYIEGWTCDAVNIHEVATFDSGYPPLIIVNIEPSIRRSEEGYRPKSVRLRDMKRQIQIGSIKYRLRALIHNKSAHFTATLITSGNNLYIYDDKTGIREARTSTDEVEFGVYTRIFDFD